MGTLIKRRWATGFSLLRRISDPTSTRNYGDRYTRNCADRKFGARVMMSTAVNSTPSSSPSRKFSPWLMLPPVIEEGGDMVYKFYNLSEDKEESFPRKNSEESMADAKFVGSSHGWLALFNQRNNNHLFLYNPITHRHIKLPPIETLPDPQINLTPNGGRGSVYKLILSSCPDEDDECIAMMIFGPERRLAFCHPCRSTEWTPIGELYYYVKNEGMFPRSYLDIVYSSTQKLFFCQTRRPLECWDLADSQSPRIHSLWDFCGTYFPSRSMERPQVRKRVNLVYAEEYNQLFLLMRYVMVRMSSEGSFAYPLYFGKKRGWDNSFPYRTTGFNAFKIDFGVEKPQFVEGSLDGLAMFIGINHSIAMSLTPQSKLNSNCIYYTDPNNIPIPPSSLYGSHDIGIFDYTNRTISPCYSFPVDIESIKRITPAPMWFTPCHH
ncbi:hypothetical protein CASFOL_001303 [Castilleja foliolosa]|uniref:KIB1-4 beta-propeller domain-containing protein n=1 Tax=Castilleja foliolosa TaxID=1961234 RepID=A0ABD3DBM8_9LAMI